MAERDYARRRKKSRSRQKGGASIAVPLAVLLLLLGGVGSGYWLGLQNGVHRTPSPDRPDLTEIIERQKQEIASLKLDKEALQASRQTTARVGELNFYHDLPKQSVEPTPVPVAEKAEPATPTPRQVIKPVASAKPATPTAPALQAGYLLQVASFKSQHDAGKLQARLAARGLKAYSKAVDLSQRGRWYRIYLGPYSRRGLAEKVRVDVLKEFKLKALIVRADS